MNNPLMMRVTTAFSQRLLEETNNDYNAAVQRAFHEAYNRPPMPRELEIATKAIAAEPDPKEGLRLFVQAMFGANSFLYSY
jgi:hypothetical protein